MKRKRWKRILRHLQLILWTWMMVWIAFRPERKLWPSLARSNYAVEAEQHRHHRKEIFERFSFLFLFHPIIPVIMNLQFCLLHVTVKKSTYEAITIPSKKKRIKSRIRLQIVILARCVSILNQTGMAVFWHAILRIQWVFDRLLFFFSSPRYCSLYYFGMRKRAAHNLKRSKPERYTRNESISASGQPMRSV